MTSTPDGRVVIDHLSKTFGSVHAVNDLSFTVEPGRVTGFLGPNGAGKTTTLRILLGLVGATSGSATIGGKRYEDIPQPQRVVGAALEAASFHPGRTARDHLLMLTPAAGVPDSRADEVLTMVGMEDAATRRVGGFSLGMRQRLALAATLLGDPAVLLLDEPANGLDPEGIAWLRQFLRFLASEGRTVLISSHMLSEVQQSVDDVVIISQGRLVHTSTIEALTALSVPTVTVSVPDGDAFAALAASQRWEVAARSVNGTGSHFTLHQTTATDVGHAAFLERIELHGLTQNAANLEQTFLSLVEGDHTSAPLPATPGHGTPPGTPPSTAPSPTPAVEGSAS